MPYDFDAILRWVSIALFSILVPLGVYVGRMNVRASRREIVRDLERLFHLGQFGLGSSHDQPVSRLIRPDPDLLARARSTAAGAGWRRAHGW